VGCGGDGNWAFMYRVACCKNGAEFIYAECLHYLEDLVVFLRCCLEAWDNHLCMASYCWQHVNEEANSNAWLKSRIDLVGSF